MPGLFLVEEEHRLALPTAEISFAEGFAARITDPATGWAPTWAAFHGQHPAGGEPAGTGGRLP